MSRLICAASVFSAFSLFSAAPSPVFAANERRLRSVLQFHSTRFGGCELVLKFGDDAPRLLNCFSHFKTLPSVKILVASCRDTRPPHRRKRSNGESGTDERASSRPTMIGTTIRNVRHSRARERRNASNRIRDVVMCARRVIHSSPSRPGSFFAQDRQTARPCESYRASRPDPNSPTARTPDKARCGSDRPCDM